MAWVVTCGDAAQQRWGPLTAVTRVLPGRPGRAEIDPVLEELGSGARLVVAGEDAALAAILQRLLRRERLDVALALLPSPGSVAATVWGVPTDPPAALALARDGEALRSVLVRDDRGGVVVGRHRVGAFTGEVYCDEHRLLTGDATALEIRPDPSGHGTVARVTGPKGMLGLRAGATVERDGRAVQLGCRRVTVERDGVGDDRPVMRRSWYPHTADWWLVRFGSAPAATPTVAPPAG